MADFATDHVTQKWDWAQICAQHIIMDIYPPTKFHSNGTKNAHT